MEWITWEGGKCPVEEDELVRIKFVNGQEEPGLSRAGEWDWDSDCCGEFTIVAYKSYGKFSGETDKIQYILERRGACSAEQNNVVSLLVMWEKGDEDDRRYVKAYLSEENQTWANWLEENPGVLDLILPLIPEELQGYLDQY